MKLAFELILICALCIVTYVHAKVEHNSNLHKEHYVKKGGELDQAARAGAKEGTVDHKKLYREMFKAKRIEQATAIQTIVSADVNKRVQFVGAMLSSIKSSLDESRSTIERAGHSSTAPFPHDSDTLKDAISRVLENTAFLGDLSVRFPDLVSKALQKDRKLNTVVVWAYNYSVDTKLFDEASAAIVNLMAQVLEFIPKRDDFTNPYDLTVDREDLQRAAIQEAADRKAEKDKERKMEQKQKKKKTGPSLTRTEL